jgi:hypothetical protein
MPNSQAPALQNKKRIYGANLLKETKKRKSGIPTGNAGEYFVMGELLRRGFDAQLADRNTKGYDMLVGRAESPSLRKVQVKTSRSSSWYVKLASFEGDNLNLMTIYVRLGRVSNGKPIRYFMVRNCDVAKDVRRQKKWKKNAFMSLKAVEPYENRWNALLK